MSLASTRRHAAPVALVTFICFVAAFLPPMPARADTAAALAPLSDGVGGPSTLGVAPPAAGSPQAQAKVDLATGAAISAFPFKLPTARGDAQPSLGLTYNSSVGVGTAGVGWTLSPPSIVRQGTGGMPTFV
ncbi:MAG: SpvB/TcaC N-terminal domain-containing protein, partial [Polyangiaceae bacterium]